MQRLVVASIVSFAAGAGVSYVIFSDGPESPNRPVQVSPSDLPLASGGIASYEDAAGPGLPAVAERARVYASVADAGVDELRAMAADALEAASRSGSSFELDAVLARLAEIDPNAALTFAREENLKPAEALRVALGVLELLGYSEQTMDDVRAALPQLDRDQLRARALERLAATDPSQALAIALAEGVGAFAGGGFFGAPLTGEMPLLMQIGARWADRDPQAALAAIDTIRDTQLRLVFAQAVASRVAQSDPDAVLAFLDIFDAPMSQKMVMTQTAIQQLALQDPARALQYAETIGGQVGQTAQAMAVQQWARQDPVAALAYVETLPIGMARENLLQQVAAAYASNDPDGALTWVRSLPSGQAQAYASVLSGIAQTDPVRALDLAFEDTLFSMGGRMQMPVLMSVIASAGRSGAVSYRNVADRVLSLENGQTRRSALQMLGQMWASNDADGALNWFLNNQEAVGVEMVRDLAQQLAREDPQTAALYSARVSPELRGQWIGAVATGYAQADAAGARRWIEQFRGEPFFEAAAAQVIRISAATDPAGAAAFWESSGFSDPVQEQGLANAIAGSWAARDWQAARNWVVSLASGPVRDGALSGMMNARQQVLDDSLMTLFSDDEIRAQAISNIVMQTAQFDPARAREMLDQYVDDPSQRAQVEERIRNFASRRQGMGFQSGRFVAPAVGISEVIVRQ